MKLTGGGIQGNKTVQSRSSVKVEPKPHAISPAGVAQQGMATQFRKEELRQGPGYKQGPSPNTGIPGTYNAATQGPGSMRAIYKSGSQSQYGPSAPGAVNQAPDPSATGTRGRDILSDFGPEASGKR
jgi:hypothetical protein